MDKFSTSSLHIQIIFSLNQEEMNMSLFPEVLLSLLATLLVYLLFCRTRRGGMVVVNWPVVGMLPTIIVNYHHLLDHITSILREFDNTIMFRGPWFCGMDFLLTCSPDNANHMFNLRFSNYGKGEEFAEIFDVLGDGIIVADGDSWVDQRRMAQAHMNTPTFRSSVGDFTINKLTKVLLPLLKDMEESHKVVDLSDVLMRFTFDAICTLVLGVDPGCLAPDFPSIPFVTAVHQVEQALIFRHIVPMFFWKLMRRLKVGKEKKIAEATEVINQFIEKCIQEKKESQKINNGRIISNKEEKEEEEGHIDIITSYMEYSIDDKFLRDTLLTYLAAGKDTTAAALIWMFWLLNNNPDVEKKILEELRKLRLSSEANDEIFVFRTEEIDGLIYLHAVLFETLRLYPSLPFNHKAAKKGDMLPSGHRVRPGTKIFFSLYSMGRMETIWGEDCLEFKPERWITEKGTLKHEPSYKFIAFHSGPRSCLGRNMGMIQMKLMASAMIYNFEVRVIEGHVAEPKASVVVLPKNGLFVKLKKRKSWNIG
ncbi:uncharacterized protein A4U43_C07F32170 [Asparagus officinalis]|uniref:noroxomaritidine synthase n=1 Tax=Asparagus officinalis TaxID=4686 RepID=A0A5P1EK59_ASPOF|nr:alkane hydroxylase MAH1-like [Asparagus officinalis]ONK64981.1 uncharacterized protein A4U43_C07F32170 [Asparagus officinalis]